MGLVREARGEAGARGEGEVSKGRSVQRPGARDVFDRASRFDACGVAMVA